MAEKDKRYYWLKLKRDFFKRHDIQIIEGMPNGKDYILFYLKLLCESVDHDGCLRFSDEIPYNEEMLSTITNTNIDIVRNAVQLFTGLKMMEILDDGTFYMNQVQKMIGSETYWAQKKREKRELENKNVGQFPTLSNECPTMSNSVPTCPSKSKSIDKDIELDIDTDIEKDQELEEETLIRQNYGEYNNVILSDEEFQKLQEEFPTDYQARIEKLSSYIASTGKTYKNHLATIRNWAKNETSKQQQKNSNKTDGNAFLALAKQNNII